MNYGNQVKLKILLILVVFKVKLKEIRFVHLKYPDIELIHARTHATWLKRNIFNLISLDLTEYNFCMNRRNITQMFSKYENLPVYAF